MSASARGKISGINDRFPRPLVLCRDPPGFRSQTAPERIVSLDRSAGIEAIEKKRLQFILCSIEVGGGRSLHNCERGIQSFFGGTIAPALTTAWILRSCSGVS